MAHTTVKVAPDGSGSDVDFQTLDTAALRQTMTVSDATVSASDSRVLNADAATSDFGLVVRPVFTGTTPYSALLQNTNNAAVVKASAGRLFSLHIHNRTATDYEFFVKIYDKATTPAPATDTALIKLRFNCLAGRDTHIRFSDRGVAFASGIGVAVTKLVADNDNTSLTAVNDGILNMSYV